MGLRAKLLPSMRAGPQARNHVQRPRLLAQSETEKMHDPRRNNFDALRLILASIVVLVHAAVLSEAEPLQFLRTILSSPLAIQGFFVISGYLIIQSYERSSSLKSYCGKRVRRIYPAYVFIIAVGVLLGVTLTTAEQFWNDQTMRYVAANLVFLNFLQPDLPGVFTGNFESAINGSLWTLKVEVMFYASVPLLVWVMRKWRRLPVLAVIFLGSGLYVHGLSWLAVEWGQPLFVVLARQLPGQMGYFAMGACAYYYGTELRGHKAKVVVAACAVFALDALLGSSAFLRPLWVSTAMIVTALWIPFLGKATRFGDLSYGVYIVHFPIIQVLISLGVYRADPVAALVITAVLVVCFSWLLWHGIESRFLRRRPAGAADSMLIPTRAGPRAFAAAPADPGSMGAERPKRAQPVSID